MELGEKLRLARQELGLSQKQVCGDTITRNMLSQLEHNTAQPSMDTLLFLAGRLKKPVSYFLDEEASLSPNQAVILEARSLCQGGFYSEAITALNAYQAPDPVFDVEFAFLQHSSRIHLAEAAIAQNKEILAQNLLTQAMGFENNLNLFPELRRHRLLLMGRLRGADLEALCKELPTLDEDLLLRAKAQLDGGNALRAGQFLDAMEVHDALWHFHRGKAYFAQAQYHSAITCLEICENQYAKEVYPLLEQCWHALGNFERAYFYACKQRA